MTETQRLSRVLWHERSLLEALVSALVTERAVTAGGRIRRLFDAASDSEGIRAELRVAEVLRAVAADDLAESLALLPNPSLSALAESVSDSWRMVLLEHRVSMLAVVAKTRSPSETSAETEPAHASASMVPASLLEFLR